MLFYRAGEKVEISNFFGWFWLKDTLFEIKKMTPQFSDLTVKDYEKFEQKANRGIQFS